MLKSADDRMTRPVPVAPMMADMVRNGIAAVDGSSFERLERCPYCGGAVRPHDHRAKRFATITDGDSVRDVRVLVKRFRCARCGRLCYADSPFYPGTRHGAPVVELAAVLAERMPAGRASRTLARLGVVLDRATVRTYAALPLPPITTMQLFGIPVPVSVLRLSSSLRSPAGTGASRCAAPPEERHER
jgi:hypothetical protein